ncbi:MAG: hypothetical protein R3A80_07810 [Bdellovibrionota bacterium]
MNKIRPLWLWLILAVLIVVLVLETRMRTQEVHSKGNVPRLSQSYSLFVPSPYELSMIEGDRDVWPRRFGPKQPLELSDLPNLYSLYGRKHSAQRSEVDFFRTVAMTATLEQWETFKSVLGFRIRLDKVTPDSLLKWAKSEKCSLYGLESAFRIVQWDATKLPEVRALFQKCDPNSFHTLWFEVLSVMASKNADQMRALKDKIQTRRQLMPNDSFVYFLLTQVFESLDLKLAHSK